MSHYNPDPNKNVNLSINGIPVTVPEGTTILNAARKINVKIPTLCDHPDLKRRSFCRLCVVEVDGRGRLMAACANDVWEGVNIVTNNARMVSIRKMILELILADHPPECLSCIRNNNCELQDLAAEFGIRERPFGHNPAVFRPVEIADETLVRDMNKCVKCGRCVEACQEVQTVRAINSSHRSVMFEICTPYGQALSEGPCIFCGHCAEVCPVGAIFEHDQSYEVFNALTGSEGQTAAQFAPALQGALEREFDLAPGTVSGGKIVSALKWIGFDKVFEAGFFADLAAREIYGELLDRIKRQVKLPMLLGCSHSVNIFIKEFYPELLDHLPAAKSPEHYFGILAKGDLVSAADKPKITSVSVMPCLAKKNEARKLEADGLRCVDFALSFREMLRMIKYSGIDIAALPESPFDRPDSADDPETGSAVPANAMEALIRNVYSAYSDRTAGCSVFGEDPAGIRETEVDMEGTKVKALTVNGLAGARTILDSIRKGECDAAFVEIKNCYMGGRYPAKRDSFFDRVAQR